jgi:hypothetical protein
MQRLPEPPLPLARLIPRAWAAGAISALFALLSPSEAAAQNQFSIDAEAAFPNQEGHENGWGVGARFGHEWDLVLVSVTPELGFNYHAFGGAPDADAFAVVGGGRVGLGFVLEPSAFLHAGVGHFGYDTLVGEVSQTSLAYEMGLALDLTLLPVIDIGAHGSYAGVAGDQEVEAFSWWAVGGHVTFVFEDKADRDR